MAEQIRLKLVREIIANMINVIFDLLVIKIDCFTGYFLKVDSKYFRKLHDRDDDYGLALKII